MKLVMPVVSTAVVVVVYLLILAGSRGAWLLAWPAVALFFVWQAWANEHVGDKWRQMYETERDLRLGIHIEHRHVWPPRDR